MGSKLHCTRNIFTALLKNKHDVLTITLNSQDPRINRNNRLLQIDIPSGFDQLQGSMDRSLEKNNRNFVRNTMLKHEDIFKEQVHELHRLYRVQKKLMAELRSEELSLHSFATATTPRAVTDTRNRFWSSTSTSETSHSSYISNRHHSTTQLNSENSSLHPQSTVAEDLLRNKKGLDLEQCAEEETPFSLEHPKELWPDGETDIELTLSIGRGSGKKKSKHWLQPEPTASETRQLLLSTTPVKSEREECNDRDSLQRPPWLFQALSLNRT